MPIKELQISFSISVEALAQALAASNHGMKIQVLGTEPEPVKLPAVINGTATPVKALPPPSHSARIFVLGHLKKHPDVTHTSRELIAFCDNFGFKQQSVYNAISILHKEGLVRKYGAGKYRVSKAGLNHG